MADPISSSTPITLIALDIAKKHHDAKILYPNGSSAHLRITNTLDGYERLMEVADMPADQIRVVFEPTTDYHRNIANWLLQQGAQCHLVSSLACAMAREMLFKTWDMHDRMDASVILYLLEQGLSNPFYDPLVQNMMDIQEISNTYNQITLARTRCLNSLVNHYLTLYFPEAEQFLHMSRAEWFCQFLLKFATPLTIISMRKATFVKRAWQVIGRKQFKQQYLEHLYDLAQGSIALPVKPGSYAIETFRLQFELSQQLLELERLAKQYLQERDDYRHLRTLPGVGPIIALMIIAESRDLTRFRHYRQYLNYYGFNLSAAQSGQFHSGYRLSKRGNARLRYAYWLAATVAIRTRENSFRYKCERYLRQNGDSPDRRRKANTAVAVKLARVAHAIVKQNVDYHGYHELSHGT